MKPKPAGLGPEHGEQFKDPSVVAAYHTRPPYPEQLISLVCDIAGASPVRLLDLGCGTGELSRRLARHVESVTAVDQSPGMIAEAQRAAGGQAANIRWVVGAVEEVPLSGDFTLALAAESFHWFDWVRVCPRVVALVPASTIILVEGRVEQGSPWAGALGVLIAEHSTNRQFEPYNLVDELISRGCFARLGNARLGPEHFRQSVDDYITCLHSRNGFSRDRMTPDATTTFDRRVRDLLCAHAVDGMLDLQIATQVSWGSMSAPSDAEVTPSTPVSSRNRFSST
jgi:SAM-dependent methyltransferase